MKRRTFLTATAVMIAAAVAIARAQAGPPQLSPEAEELQKRFPYPVIRDQRGVVPPGPRPLPSPPLGDGPWVYSTLEQRDIKVSVVTRGLSHPWSLAFLPDGSMLITERAGRLRIVRNGRLDPAPVAGTPQVLSRATMAGLMDIALHPSFAQNRWIYISYHKPLAPGVAANSILRGTWDGKALTDVRDVFVSDDVDTEASRIAFGADGMLYMGIGGPGTGPRISVDRAQHTNDLAGKILRLRDDGSVPPDNPFAGRSGYKPAIFTVGHRVQLGLALNPFTGEMWEHENGPNGGDEVNVLKSGRNYGWPIVSYGRDYNGPRFPPTAPGFEEPVVFWVPSIAASGLAFYAGDRFPNWKRNAFVGGLREGEVAPSGQLQRIVFNDKWEELRREPLLRDLHQRIRDVRQGPDGLLYLLTDEEQAVLVRIEPVAPTSSAVHNLRPDYTDVCYCLYRQEHMAKTRRTERMASTIGRRRSTRRAGWVRKNVVMDQRKLDVARRALGVDTETEAIDRALDFVGFSKALEKGFVAVRRSGGVRDVLERRRRA